MLINCYFSTNLKRDETLKGDDATSDCLTTIVEYMCYLQHLAMMLDLTICYDGQYCNTS